MKSAVVNVIPSIEDDGFDDDGDRTATKPLDKWNQLSDGLLGFISSFQHVLARSRIASLDDFYREIDADDDDDKSVSNWCVRDIERCRKQSVSL